MFKSRFKNLLEMELERFNTLSAELFPDAADEPSLMKVVEAATAASFAGAAARPGAVAETKTFTNLRTGDGI
jgi:hypothetical protein